MTRMELEDDFERHCKPAVFQNQEYLEKLRSIKRLGRFSRLISLCLQNYVELLFSPPELQPYANEALVPRKKRRWIVSLPRLVSGVCKSGFLHVMFSG